MLLALPLNPDQTEAPVIGDDQGSEDRHEEARPRVDSEDAGEAGGTLDDGIEAWVECVAQDCDGEGETAA